MISRKRRERDFSDFSCPEERGADGSPTTVIPNSMVPDQAVLTDFLNHGILPFVGREKVIERLRAFRGAAADASGLRTFLIAGEAGIGKSRLIEETIPVLEGSGGAVAHFRLRPASGGSPVALLADALWHSPTVRPLLRARPSRTLDSVLDALRRLCRLRPAVIVVEDIHLLAGETLQDFAALLGALADDPVSLVCASRPPGEGTLALLGPSLAEQVDLSGLAYDEIARLGDVLFGPNGAEETIRTIAEVTLGNPLAIRGALRGALRQETILRQADGGWRGDERFRDVVRLGARSITEGLAVHLTPEQRRAADALASLGEIFSCEAAEILLGEESEPVIEGLLFKGILVRSLTAATPLPNKGRSGSRLLAFTHTLVHHTLIREGKVPAMKLLEVFERQAPLYSIVPYLRLADVASLVPAEDRLRLVAVVDEGIAVAAVLDESSEWNLARELTDALERISLAETFTPEEKIDLELRLLDARLRLLERDLQGEEYGQRLERLFALALALPEEDAPPYLICAFAHRYKRMVYSGDGEEHAERLEREIDALVKLAPEVVCTEGYVRYLGWRTERASLQGDWQTQEEVERHIEGLLVRPGLPEELREALQSALRTNYLLLVRTPEEYSRRLARIEETDEKRRGLLTEVSWLLQKGRFYGFTGHFKRQWEVYRQALRFAENRGQKDIVASLGAGLVRCRAAMGLPLQEAEDALLRMGAIAPTDVPEGVEDPVGTRITTSNLAATALMNGADEWAVRFYDRYFGARENNPTTLPILLALYRDDPAGELEFYGSHPWLAPVSGGIIRMLRGGGSGEDFRQAGEFLHDTLAAVPVATRHILHIRVGLRLHALLARSVPSFRFPADILRAGLRAALEWGRERELWLMMNACLHEFGGLLPEKEAAEWTEQSGAIENANRRLFRPEQGEVGRARLTMFGAVHFIPSPDAPSITPRGRRLKTLLGVMAANETLARPLGRDEFLLIASGNADDPRHARDVVNKTVSRLREGLGNADLILTDGETPRLNREALDVDILEALQAVARAREALRRRALMKAMEEVRRALDLWNGEVPYPTLYDEFFESLREEFELAVRDAVLLLAQGLIDEGDHAGAEGLLRRLHEITPEDAEVGELLVRALEADGRKVEAMRARQPGLSPF